MNIIKFPHFDMKIFICSSLSLPPPATYDTNKKEKHKVTIQQLLLENGRQGMLDFEDSCLVRMEFHNDKKYKGKLYN